MPVNKLYKVVSANTAPAEEDLKTYVCLQFSRSDTYNDYYRILSQPKHINIDDVYAQAFEKNSFGYRVQGNELVVYKD